MSDRLFDPINNPSTKDYKMIAGGGELEIEYEHHVVTTRSATYYVDLKCTIAYKYWSIDTESVDAEYKFMGSINYLPSDFEQLIRDYMIELPELKGIRINELKPVTK